jgi:hypothetical protein
LQKISGVSTSADHEPQPVYSKIFDADMKLSVIKILKPVITASITAQKLLQHHNYAEAAGKSLAHAIEFSLERLL